MTAGPYDDRILELLTDSRNRNILSLLDEGSQPRPLSALAEELVSLEEPVLSDDEYRAAIERVTIELHHTRLPKLDEAGLVSYDGTDRTVRFSTGRTPVDWLTVDAFRTLLDRPRAGPGPQGDAVGVIEGADAVVERGRALAAEARDELFLMYVSDELLEQECLQHARAAIDRGVEIVLGSANTAVRDLARRKLPEATLWEPQFDWMNSPSRFPKVGRLVLADRESVMIAVLNDPAEPGTREVALTGEGASNPLVVLVRDLLGPRLDHLDYQSEHFRRDLPF